ncbi:transcriptional regulator [Spiribacter roseus]|nr:transcriptional regulator [Spiribacter roseus]
MPGFIGYRVRIKALCVAARKQRGWTQAFVAERAGLRQETISIIENGAKPSRLSSILAVLAALDLEFRVAERSKWQPQDIEALF